MAMSHCLFGFVYYYILFNENISDITTFYENVLFEQK